MTTQALSKKPSSSSIQAPATTPIAQSDTDNKATGTAHSFPPAYFKAPVQSNEAVEQRLRAYTKPLTANQVTSVHVRRQIMEKGKDLDPDKTFLVTIAYDHRTNTPPYKGVIVQKISLTDAAKLNIQDVDLPSRMGKRTGEDGPFQIKPSSRHNETPTATGTFELPDQESGFTSYYQGIYTEPAQGSENVYDQHNKVDIPPADFKQMVWEYSYKTPYDEYLDDYWDNNSRHAYKSAATGAYLKTAHTQHHDGSLSENDRRIAMGVAGLPADKKYADLNDHDLSQPYKADPNLETKFLTFNGFEMRAFYTRDKTTGRVLLYLPGQTPALKGFNAVQDMNKWLGEQVKDPQKAAALKFYFRPQDRPTEFRTLGADARLDFVGSFLAGDFPEEKKQKQGYWEEGGLFGGQVTHGNPFEEMQRRTEADTKAATSQQFVLNRDVKEQIAFKYLNYASYGLILLAPLGVAFPPVGAALTGVAIGIGAAKLGIGIDSYNNGRPGADKRVVEGIRDVLKPLFVEGFGQAGKPISAFIKGLVFKA
ncbi:dermonecrotic toxin domain-containing protein [Pseudomonas sp. MPB26]|uniref:dermonecrotic toxin domain-containing protein n=1 Tax=Pseudomonas sp. MPB26 TaxID=3388491 RepID=UPI003984E1C4